MIEVGYATGEVVNGQLTTTFQDQHPGPCAQQIDKQKKADHCGLPNIKFLKLYLRADVLLAAATAAACTTTTAFRQLNLHLCFSGGFLKVDLVIRSSNRWIATGRATRSSCD